VRRDLGVGTPFERRAQIALGVVELAQPVQRPAETVEDERILR
jgi:hypothetical protein